ncbi:MgtC/SapB family protein [Carnobacterium mobile]|uniref:MgtC/SapB family protein n=1 Tax=Carnobacterium mobile TaxID=2750 RepID=UPI0005588ACA|nr:MgtC/SapB family protein [Carnobacterium mobile]
MELNKIFFLRLVLASILGGSIGINRELRAKEAGIRTHFLVSLGSALIMIISQHGFNDVIDMAGYELDPARVSAQVVSGIGFIGAGMIIIQKYSIKGLTSAAGIWTTAGIGLTVGGGLYFVGISATILTLIGFELTTIIFKQIGTKTTMFEISTPKKEILQDIIQLLRKKNRYLQKYEVKDKKIEGETVYYATFYIRSNNPREGTMLLEEIQTIPDVIVERADFSADE